MMELEMRDNQKKEKPPLTPRQKRYVTWGWIVPVILGLALGIASAWGSGGSSIEDIVKGTGHVDPMMGLMAAVLTGPSFLLIMYRWHKSLDEQEERAILWGNTLGLYFGLALWAAWTLLAAAALVSPVDVTIVLALSAGLSLAYWVWKKFL